MKINDQTSHFTDSNMIAPTEGTKNIHIRNSFTSAKDRSFTEIESLLSLPSYFLEEPEDSLRQSVIRQKSSNFGSISPKIDTQILDDIFLEKNVLSFANNSPVYLKWRKLLLIAKAVYIFKKQGFEVIKTARQLTRSVSNTSLPKREKEKRIQPWIITDQVENRAIDDFRNKALFFQSLERGNDEDLIYIREALKRDPTSYLYEPDSPDRRTNKPNNKGYTPLYLACKNGNLKLLKLLLEFKANPYQLCDISSKEHESILMVGVRWGHLELVQYLMGSTFKWPQSELAKALAKAKNEEMKIIISFRIIKRKKSLKERLLCTKSVETEND